MILMRSRPFPCRFFSALFCLTAVWLPALSLAQSQDWRQINRDVLEEHVMPAYTALAEAGSRLSERGDALCSSSDEATMREMRDAWQNAMDAWQSVQHIRFGPVTYFNWQYRLQYWPDERGTGNRQLTALLTEADPAVLEQETFTDQSVGVQGLPALEVLLFGEDSEALMDSNYRCQVARTIAGNIGNMTRDIQARWEQEFSATLMLDDDSGLFMDHSDATTELLKALVESVPLLTDQKLALPMGDNAERFRLGRAESWRSERSLRNIRLNVQALSALYEGQADRKGLAAAFPEDHVATIDQHFDTVKGHISDLPDGFEAVLGSDNGYDRLTSLRQSLDALYEALEAAVKDTDLYLGFNSLDGD